MVVRVPWEKPERRFKTLIDAVLATREAGETVWFVLEDGKLLNPDRISDLRSACDDGSILNYELE
jgi:hypothetical protein